MAKRISKDERNRNIVLETYHKMYEVSEPSLDFMNYIQTTCNYRDKDSDEKIITEKHLSIAEMHDRNLVIDVPFDNYEITKDNYYRIINEQIKKYKLSKVEQSQLNTQIALGCSPTFKK